MHTPVAKSWGIIDRKAGHTKLLIDDLRFLKKYNYKLPPQLVKKETIEIKIEKPSEKTEKKHKVKKTKTEVPLLE